MSEPFSPVLNFRHKRHLPRLAASHYRGRAFVFWTHTVDKRRTGWLTPATHLAFREAFLHAQAREQLTCPLYVLMPDHLHCLWIGVSAESDQRLASRALRRQINALIAPHRLQDQAHDHVLREEERSEGAFASIWQYMAENPQRAQLVEDWRAYPYLGALVPGYPGLDPREIDFLGRFWRVYAAFSERCR